MWLLFSALCFCITLASALRINEPVAVTVLASFSHILLSLPTLFIHQQSRATQTCGDQSDAVPFYQTFNSATVDYYYTVDGTLVDDVFAGGYVLQGVAGLVFVTQEESTVPFYRLAKPSPNGVVTDFYTTNTTERDTAIQQGFLLESSGDTLTFIYPTEICGAVPFYRVFNPGAQATFYTTSQSERQSFIAKGYQDLGIAGYILPL
ncbi:hypothetical protein B0H14DRAFT_2754600 [Mycena olivaceomarginata]|jgi:hypothetical protein|nr:hypothetical protein B0H14DRAFT_2754600 [Mycena olivaceomarginata]